MFFKKLTFFNVSLLCLFLMQNIFADTIKMQEYSMPTNINEISIDGVFKVEITTNNLFFVKIQTEEKTLGKIKVNFLNNVLIIKSENIVTEEHPKVFINLLKLKKYTSMGVINSIINIRTDEVFNLHTEGISKIILVGNVSKFNVEASGQSEIYAKELNIKQAFIKLRDISTIQIKNNIDVQKSDISGISNIQLVD